MMRQLAVVADYLNDSHRAHIEKMAGDAGFTVDYFTAVSYTHLTLPTILLV